MIHGAHIVEAHHSEPGYEKKAREHAKAAEIYISEHSNELGIAMVNCIYGDSGGGCADRRRK